MGLKVLIVSAVFPPEPVVSARLSQDLKTYLQTLGHAVLVVCPIPSRGVNLGAGGGTLVDRKGIIRLDSFRSPKSTLLGRARESLDFGRQTAQWILNADFRADVIYVNVWPLFGQRIIVRTAEDLSVPVVLHVQDVYPESLATKLPRWLYWISEPVLLALDRAVTKRCAAVVPISERIGRAYAKTRRVTDRTHVVRNWVDASQFSVPHNRPEVCAQYEVPTDRFTFMYLGNLSALSGLDVVIRAFARIASPQRQLVIVGEGSTKEACRRLVKDLGLETILFRSEPDPEKVARVQTMADVFLLPTRKGGAISSTPSKCISYMLSGRPILAAVDAESDTADDIRKGDCGWICEPENVEALAATMEMITSLTTTVRSEKGDNARQYGRGNFDRKVGVKALAGIIVDAAQKRTVTT